MTSYLEKLRTRKHERLPKRSSASAVFRAFTAAVSDLWIPLVLAVAALGCGGEASLANTNRTDFIDSAGATLAVNYGPDKELDWSVEELFQLTGPDGEPKEFSTLQPTDLGVDSSGHIWVLDRSVNQVFEFSAEGEELRSLGRSGSGPGEFEMAGGMIVRPGGEIWVKDWTKQAFVTFQPDGTPGPEVPIRRESGLVQGARHYSNGKLLLEIARRGSNPLTQLWTLDIAGTEDTIRLLSMPMERRPATFEECGVMIAMPPLFAKRLGWFTNGNSVVATREAEYVLDLFKGDTLAMRISRDIPVRLTTPDMAVRDLGEGMSLGIDNETCMIPPEVVADKLGMAGSLPVVDDVAMAPDGTIWVKRQSFPDEPGKIDIFSPDGRYQGTLVDLVSLPAAFLPDGGFLTIDLDSLDVPRVSARRLENGKR